MSNRLSRRDSILAAPALLLAGRAQGANGGKLKLAGVGVGGVGTAYLKGVETESIVALCDVDWQYAQKTFTRYPDARRYRDYREMLAKEKDLDGVVIGTPDHTHAIIAMAAMKAGKHVYCAKPLTRTIAEARRLAAEAKRTGVATQMSVQSSMSDAACAAVEWVQAGAVGKVHEAHVWTDRPVWPQGLMRPAAAEQPPPELSWDLWLGPAPLRPYHSAYHPFVWRGWVDFGTGALGDMACHAFHTVVRAVDPGPVARVSASMSKVVVQSLDAEGRLRPKTAQMPETFPHAAVVTWDFVSGFRLVWYEGGLKPPRPAGMPAGETLAPAGGVLYTGEKGTLLTGFTGGPKLLMPDSRRDSWMPPKPSLERTKDHYQEWIAACRGVKPATCEFGFGASITELALLGVLATRAGGRVLDWDASRMQFRHDAEANRWIDEPYRPPFA